jgi:hypothetical protein
MTMTPITLTDVSDTTGPKKGWPYGRLYVAIKGRWADCSVIVQELSHGSNKHPNNEQHWGIPCRPEETSSSLPAGRRPEVPEFRQPFTKDEARLMLFGSGMGRIRLIAGASLDPLLETTRRALSWAPDIARGIIDHARAGRFGAMQDAVSEAELFVIKNQRQGTVEATSAGPEMAALKALFVFGKPVLSVTISDPPAAPAKAA